MMRTWFYSTSVVLDRTGGQAARVFEICRALARHVDVVIFAPLGPSTPSMPQNVRFVDVPLPARAPRNLRFQTDLYRKMSREPVPDAYYTYAGSVNFPGLWYARSHGIPALLEVNGILNMEYPLEHPPRNLGERMHLTLRTAFNDLNAFLDYHLATAVLPVTDQLISYIRRRYAVPRRKFLVATNGANAETWKPGIAAEARARLGLPVELCLVGYVGTFAQWQGLESLVEAFSIAINRRHDLKLLMVGSGPRESALCDLARALAIEDRILWCGQQPRERVHDYIQACDFVAAPFTLSARNRAMGVSALKLGEYMASGRAVVSTACPGLEFIDRESIGLLARPDDPDDIAKKILYLAGHPEDCAAMGLRARALAEGPYSWDAVVKRIIDRFDGRDIHKRGS